MPQNLYDTYAPTKRIFEKGKTYRLPRSTKEATLLWFERGEGNTLIFKDQRTEKLIKLPRKATQKWLDEGRITVLAGESMKNLIPALKKVVAASGETLDLSELPVTVLEHKFLKRYKGRRQTHMEPEEYGSVEYQVKKVIVEDLKEYSDELEADMKALKAGDKVKLEGEFEGDEDDGTVYFADDEAVIDQVYLSENGESAEIYFKNLYATEE